MKLSILICAVFERDFSRLVANLMNQIDRQINDQGVEILVLSDNRKRSTGRKRQALLNAAQGDYVTFIDDDDDVSSDYLAEVLMATKSNADVIVFNSEAQLLGYGFGENPYIVRCGIEYENQESRMEGDRRVDITRKPWHWCIWKTALAQTASFADTCVDDDWQWLRQLMPKIKTQHRIDRVLHFYQFNCKTSLAK